MAKQAFEKKEITKKSKNISDWYNDVVLKAELADYGPARGTMVIRPWGYSIWEKIQEYFDSQIKAGEMGVQNVYFPSLIPERLLTKEKEHVKGFAPHLAIVTIGGGKELKEKLIVRPTSETIMYPLFAKWISSWRDLPLKINQWVNVVRWELRTMLFMRTSEFLWQEGHTAHTTEQNAKDFALRALGRYEWLYKEILSLPFYSGRKSESEKFAGAKTTYTIELLMPDGKALQGATSHELGQNFAKAFGITFQDKDGENKYVWQTSWGISTRSIGALIMIHGDDNGLVLPPKLAPTQVAIIPIFDGEYDEEILKMARTLRLRLEKDETFGKGFNVEVDEREQHTPGWKFNYWELRGVPILIEIGSKELKTQRIAFGRRDKREKQTASLDSLRMVIRDILNDIQNDLYNKAYNSLIKNTKDASDYTSFKRIIREDRGFIRAYWCEKSSCEEKIKTDTKATSRVLTFEEEKNRLKGKCIICADTALHRWLFAQAY